MSIQEQKITQEAIAANGVQSQADKLTGTAAQNKKVFDALVTAVVREKFNALLDELTGSGCAAQLGVATIPGFSASDIQTALEQLAQAMQDVTQGSVSDGSITLAKLAAEVTAVALGGAAAEHTHAAADVVSGTLELSRFPVLDAAHVPVLGADKLGAGSVETEKLAAAAVTAEKLAALAVLSTHISPGAVTAQKLAADAVKLTFTNGGRSGVVRRGRDLRGLSVPRRRASYGRGGSDDAGGRVRRGGRHERDICPRGGELCRGRVYLRRRASVRRRDDPDDSSLEVRA